MVNRDLLALNLSELAERTARARGRVPASAEELAADRDALDLVAFNIMLAVQACADIASHVIADERWPVARNVADAFLTLRDHGVISAATAAALARAAGLRNVVAHGYARLDVGALYTAATTGIRDLSGFAMEVAAFADRGPTRD